MTPTQKSRLTLEQLRTERVYIELTPKQKKLVETFIATNGDRVASVLAASETKSPENARILAYEYFANPRVVACLTAYFQSDPLEDFKAEVRAAYRNKKLSVAQVDAMKLHAKLCGWTSDSLPPLNGYEPKVVVQNTPASRVPEGCRGVRDKEGELKGYIDTAGTFVPLATVEVTQ